MDDGRWRIDHLSAPSSLGNPSVRSLLKSTKMIGVRLLAALLIPMACSCALAQVAPPQSERAAPTAQAPAVPTPLSPHLFTFYGSFERVREGWRCKGVGSAPPALLRELQVGDVVVAINARDLVKASPIGLLQFLRLAEFDVAETAEVVRAGQHVKWTRGDSTPQMMEPQITASQNMAPQIIASQHSLKVLHSSYAPVQGGDVLHALNQTTFAAMMGTVTNPLTSVVNIEVRPGKTMHVTRDGQPTDVSIDRAVMVRLVQFELDPAQEPPPSEVLHGLSSKKVALSSLRGWTLLHFWATWCLPCMRHMPDIRELAERKDLFVAAVGFADTDQRLREAAVREKDLKVFAPNLSLQRELAITGIPFDALLEPDGKAVLVIAGDMPGEQFRNIVAQYVRQ
jgi:thiol-disulfide isomerase/thioredoxin